MTIASYLGQLKYADIRFKQLMEKAEEWHNIAIGTGLNTDGSGDRVQTSKRYDKMESAIIEAAEYEKQAIENYSRLVKLKGTIENQLASLSKVEYGMILEYYYVKNLTEGEVSAILGMPERSLKRYKSEAIREFDDKYGHLYRKRK